MSPTSAVGSGSSRARKTSRSSRLGGFLLRHWAALPGAGAIVATHHWAPGQVWAAQVWGMRVAVLVAVLRALAHWRLDYSRKLPRSFRGELLLCLTMSLTLTVSACVDAAESLM